MTKQTWSLAITLGFISLGLFPRPALAAFNIRLVNASYDTHFSPSEPVRFVVTIRNDESVSRFAEVDISITSIDTGAELTLTPVLTGTIAAGDQIIVSHAYVASPFPTPTSTAASANVPLGNYTVAFTLFDGNGDRADQIRGKYPLHIGNETESLRVFPEMINLGTLPPGRHLHPTPIEIRWNFYRFNRLRQDQPFNIRIYTDNAARFEGIPHSLRRLSPAGLVSLDGRYAIPLKCWTLNFGPDIQETGWDAALAGPPPVDEDDYWLGPPLLEGGRSLGSASWVRVPDLVDMTPDPITWRRLIGQDLYDSRFASDSNATGDFTLKSPFTLYLATEAGPAAVEGSYATTLVVELWSP